MKRFLKHTFACILALIMIVSLLPAALAEEPAHEQDSTTPEVSTDTVGQISFDWADSAVQLAAVEQPTSGTYSNGIQWAWEDFRLTISGSGDIPEGESPWDYYAIHEAYIGEGITSLNSSMFSAEKGLTYVQLPSTLKRIGDSAFANAWSLSGIQLPYGLETIGKRAFYNCADLAVSILLPDTVTAVGEEAFYGSGITSIVIPDSVGELKRNTFAYAKNLRSVTLPQGIKGIPDGLFLGAGKLRTIDLPDSIISIGASAFKDTGLAQIELPEGLTKLGSYCFKNTHLVRMGLPGSLETLMLGVFEDCRYLTEVNFGEGVAEIPEKTFDSCTKLSAIVLPASVETVDSTAFAGCTSLRGVYFRGPGINTDYAESYNSRVFPAHTQDFAIYHMADQPDWADLPYQGCSRTTWYNYPLKVWNGDTYGMLPITDYYRTLSERTIRLLIPGFNFQSEDYSVKVTATVTGATGESTVYPSVSVSRPYLTYKLPLTDSDTVTFTCEGFLPLTIPAKLLGSFSRFRLWRPRADGGPVVQYVLVDRMQGDHRTFVNIRDNETLRVPVSSKNLYSLYIGVDWGNQSPGKIRLMQGSREMTSLQAGWNYHLRLGEMLYQTAGECALRLECDGAVYQTGLKLLPVSPVVRNKVGIETGDRGHSDPLPEETEILSEKSVALDLSALSDELIPFMVDIKPDGTVRATLGLSPAVFKGGTEEADWATAFNQIKGALGSVKNNSNLSEENKEKLIKMLEDRKGETLWGSWSFSSQLQVIGYLEGIIDEEGIRPKECAVLVRGKGGVIVYYPYAIGPFDRFAVYSIAGAEVEIGVPLILQSVEKETDEGLLSPKGDAFMDGTVTFFGGKAMGNKHVKAHLRVNGELITKNPFPLDWDTTNIIYSVYLSAEGVVLGLAGKWKIASTPKFYILKDGQWCNEKVSARLMTIPQESWFEPGRDYLELPSVFGANRAVKLLSAGDETISESLFLSNVYPYAKVQQVLYSNGDRLMVWVGDNPDRTDGNRSALYYSFYQQADGVWSDPALVTSEANGSGTADFYPALICENDTAHLVWCDAEIPQSGTAGETVELETLQAHMRALNIGYARFDRNEAAFADYAMLEGMEDSADVQPSVTVVNGQPVVVWASNSAGDLMLADGTTNLYSAELTESGWVQTVLESSVSGIDGIAATEEDEGLAVYYTRQSDGLTNDLTARELYRYFEEKTEAVTDNEVPDCGPTVQTNRLSWYQDGAIRTKDRVLLPEANEIGDSYQYLRNSTGTEAILYSALTDAESDALYARFCEDTVHWGEPVLLAEATSFHDFSGVLLADGTLAVVASRTVEDGESSTTDLVYYKAEPVCDLAVVSAKYDPFSLGEQRMLSVLLDVENLSSASVHETEIRFYDGATLLGTDFSATPIVSGAKTTLDVVCPLPELEQVPASLRVEVVPVEIEDPVEENNSAEILLNLTDLSLEAMYAENVLTASGDSTIVTVCAVNRGVTETAPASLALHLDAADGIVPVPEQEIPALEAGASAMLVFQLEEPLAEGDVLYAVAEELDRENIAANNSIFTMIQTVDYGAAGIFTHNVFAEKSEQGVTVMLQADNTSAAGVSVYFLTAAYSGEEMLDANIEDVQLSANTEGWSKAVFLDAKTADTVKVFLLNKDFRPISGVKVVDLP